MSPPGSQQSLTQWPFLPQFRHFPFVPLCCFDFLSCSAPLSAVPPELASRDQYSSKICTISASDIRVGSPALTAVMKVDHVFGSDINRVFEKCRSDINSPIACNVCCRPRSLRTCSSMFSPSWANVRKNSRHVLIIPIGPLASKIVARASHTPFEVVVLCVYIM